MSSKQALAFQADAAPALQAPPIFIVGAGRSGTTLMRAFLSAHSRIAVTPESHYMKFAIRHGADQRPAPADFQQFWSAWIATGHFQELDIHPARCLAILERTGERSFRGIFAALLAAYGERTDKPRVGEKTPGHYRYLSQLLDWFPNARVIFMRRDPRAVVASSLKVPWVRQRLKPPSPLSPWIPRLRLFHVAEQARGWRRIYGDYLPRHGDDPRVLVVDYEALVRQPEVELRRVCGFLEVAWEPTMVEERRTTVPRASDRRIASHSEDWHRWSVDHESKATSAVFTDSLERWRDELSGLERALVESRCAATMAQVGYGFSVGRLGRRMARTLAQGLSATGALEYRLRGRTPERR